MRFSVAVFPAGPSWNCAVLLHPGGRAWLSLCLRRPQNLSRCACSLMSPILLTRCLSRLRAWTLRGCFGFDAEKPGTEDRGPSLKTPSYFAGVGKETGKTRSVGAETKKPRQIHGWRHPRELMRGVEKAIPSVVGKQTVAAESAQIHVVARCAGEQIERDRENESEVDAILRVKSPLIFADHRQLTHRHRICKPFGC
jgi:hypothetical protein